MMLVCMVSQAGFEPATFPLGGTSQVQRTRTKTLFY